MPLLLGIDIGTTNVKATLFDLQGDERASTTARVPVTFPGQPGWSEFDPEGVFRAVVDLIRDLTERSESPHTIGALAISSMGETGVPLGDDGEPVYPAIAWYDRRTSAQRDWWETEFGAEVVYSIAGLPLSTSYGLMKLMWLKENVSECFQACSRWLPIGDYVAYRLCGLQVTDPTLAWRTMAFDIHQQRWSDALLTEAGVDPALMPEVVPSGTPLGSIRGEIARITGLDQGCLVVSGGMDAVCAMAGAGAVSPGIVLDIIGTSEIVLTTLEDVERNSRGLEDGLDIGPHLMPDSYLAFGSLTASGAVVAWFAEKLKGPCGQDDATLLSDLTSRLRDLDRNLIPVLLLPHFQGSRTPHRDERSRGALVGLTTGVDHIDLFCGILAGLSLEAQKVFDSLENLTSRKPRMVVITGGGAQNPLWMSLKADFLQHSVRIPQVTSLSGFGAALLAGYGAGYFPTLRVAVEEMPVKCRVVEWDQHRMADYRTNYAVAYDRLYDALRDVSQALSSGQIG